MEKPQTTHTLRRVEGIVRGKWNDVRLRKVGNDHAHVLTARGQRPAHEVGLDFSATELASTEKRDDVERNDTDLHTAWAFKFAILARGDICYKHKTLAWFRVPC
jgi:hypothetical protein